MQCWTLTVLSGLCVLGRLSRCSLLLLVIITKHLLKLALEFLEKRHDALSFCVETGNKIGRCKEEKSDFQIDKARDSQENTKR